MWVVAVVAAVVLVVGVVVTYAVTRTTSQPPGPAPTTTSPEPQETPPTPDAPVGGYKIEAGDGGTDVAVDGRTPIGYDQECSGAVSAATNYYVAVLEGLYQDRHTSESFSELLKQINGGLDGWDTAPTGPISGLVTEFEAIRAEAEQLGQEFLGGEYHPEWGVFRVEGCAEGASATVDVAGYFEMPTADPGHSYQDPKRVRVSWFEGDWRLISLEDLATDENPLLGILPSRPLAPVPAADRGSILAAAGSEWMEYTNAPQD